METFGIKVAFEQSFFYDEQALLNYSQPNLVSVTSNLRQTISVITILKKDKS